MLAVVDCNPMSGPAISGQVTCALHVCVTLLSQVCITGAPQEQFWGDIREHPPLHDSNSQPPPAMALCPHPWSLVLGCRHPGARARSCTGPHTMGSRSWLGLLSATHTKAVQNCAQSSSELWPTGTGI